MWTVKAKGQEIQILSAPYYLATKFEAFNDRGNDYRTSHDMEDIIYVMDNRILIAEEVINTNKIIKQFIQDQFLKMINKDLLDEVLIDGAYTSADVGRADAFGQRKDL